MKKTIGIICCIMVLAFAGTALAGDGGFYGSVKVGGSFLDASKSSATNATATGASSKFKNDTGLAVGGAVGYNWMDYDMPIRTELEYMYRGDFKYKYSDSNSTLTDKIDLHTLMLNGYWDFYNSTSFTPYINGGVGIAWVQEDFSTGTITDAISAPKNKTSTNLALNLGAGVGWSMTESMILDLAYRYNYYGDGKKVTASGTGNSVTTQVKDIGTHDVLLGLRYQF